jgi:PiT family inorganic phosphate transporter
MTAVGAIVGLGLATGTLNAALMFTILSAWIVAPLCAALTGVVVGRYLYPHLDARLAFGRLNDPPIRLDRSETLPRLVISDGLSTRDLAGSLLVVAIACYMAFSAGASNAANAVAPLVGNGALSPSAGILLAVASISLGGFTIARRTLSTVGDDVTDLPILAALVVSTVGATIITVLSWLGIPASLAVSTTSCIIGLGWGRASRAQSLAEIATPVPSEDRPPLTTGALTAPPTGDGDDAPHAPTVGDLAEGEAPAEQTASEGIPRVGEEDPEPLAAESLFDSATTVRIVTLWLLTPVISVVGSYLLFSFVV